MRSRARVLSSIQASDLEYNDGISHYLSSNSEVSKCVVEPGSAEDVSKILRILGRTRTQFAVKGGGHAFNPGFSSTPGVQIYMRRFSSIHYDAEAQTVEIGIGLLWDDVYAALAPFGVNVVGSRSKGIGVAGPALGGGLSFKSNQYGLTVDTVTSYKLVKPEGQIVTVNSASDSDLFFGLKGGLNNFGIVTTFTLKTFPQTQVWGGVITFVPTELSKVNEAVSFFSSEVKDPRAMINLAYISIMGSIIPAAHIFYDGPTPPTGTFDRFLSISTLTSDVKTRSFLDFFQVGDANATIPRGRSHTLSLQAFTPNIVETIVEQAQFWGSKLATQSGTMVVYVLEPFLPDAFNRSKSATAFPPNRSPAFLPLEAIFEWTSPSSDHIFINAIKESIGNITAAAVEQGQSLVPSLPIYGNYAIDNIPLEQIYGQNVPRLKALKARIDPCNVMGLAGGFKF
ncbi:hypothetical protein CPB83DRAFT_906772 [Crepidotus variabilis]|uniref:FAD-binding PCMH-type domain-containing protein n=1 Tax=Crepidotus variabilis TaxID=179855 RepID=A0A9P6EGG0_9AGAR|nr:hypothetical protein CPB83DRAFT_906772 [Crepidotus variabilis]